MTSTLRVELDAQTLKGIAVALWIVLLACVLMPGIALRSLLECGIYLLEKLARKVRR